MFIIIFFYKRSVFRKESYMLQPNNIVNADKDAQNGVIPKALHHLRHLTKRHNCVID